VTTEVFRKRRGARQSQQLIAIGKIHKLYKNVTLHYFSQNIVEKLSEGGMRALGVEHERHGHVFRRMGCGGGGYNVPVTHINLAAQGKPASAKEGILYEERVCSEPPTYAESQSLGELIPSSVWIIPTGQLVRYSSRFWYMPAIFNEKLIWVVRLFKDPYRDTLYRVRNLQNL